MPYNNYTSLLLFLLFLINSLALADPISLSYNNKAIKIIVSDMSQPHEAKPHGVPSRIDWINHPLIQAGNNIKNFYAMTAWGQLYLAEGTKLAKNTRVQLKNIKACFLSQKDGLWHIIQNSSLIKGAAFREDYFENIHKKANIRYQGDGISVLLEDGYNFHFWPPKRVTIDPNDIKAIITSVQARLIIDNILLPDDRDKASYILSMGGDYWSDLSSDWDHYKTNRGIAIGRFRFVKPEWQTYYMSTIGESDLRSNPPKCD